MYVVATMRMLNQSSEIAYATISQYQCDGVQYHGYAANKTFNQCTTLTFLDLRCCGSEMLPNAKDMQMLPGSDSSGIPKNTSTVLFALGAVHFSRFGPRDGDLAESSFQQQLLTHIVNATTTNNARYISCTCKPCLYGPKAVAFDCQTVVRFGKSFHGLKIDSLFTWIYIGTHCHRFWSLSNFRECKNRRSW